MMKLSDIPRLRVGQEVKARQEGEVVSMSEREMLAMKAKTVLGYGVLSGEINGTYSQCEKELGKLAIALLGLDIEVLDMNSVFKYQVEESARRTQQELERLLRAGQAVRIFNWGFSPASWQSTDIKSYPEAIPEFVLHKAVQIKEACPEVTFKIQHLSDPKADPFLVAILSGEVYYVEAWDEPRFEGRLR